MCRIIKARRIETITPHARVKNRMKDITTNNAEETIADLIGLTRPHTPGLERATRRHRMVRALEPIFAGGLRGPFGGLWLSGCAGVQEAAPPPWALDELKPKHDDEETFHERNS